MGTNHPFEQEKGAKAVPKANSVNKLLNKKEVCVLMQRHMKGAVCCDTQRLKNDSSKTPQW
jgi:hypothetical protein